jgi:hypothetical protein
MKELLNGERQEPEGRFLVRLHFSYDTEDLVLILA